MMDVIWRDVTEPVLHKLNKAHAWIVIFNIKQLDQ